MLFLLLIRILIFFVSLKDIRPHGEILNSFSVGLLTSPKPGTCFGGLQAPWCLPSCLQMLPHLLPSHSCWSLHIQGLNHFCFSELRKYMHSIVIWCLQFGWTKIPNLFLSYIYTFKSLLNTNIHHI